MSAMPIHRVLLEGVPIAALVGAAGILFGLEWLAWIVLIPLALGLVAVVAEATRHVRQAREDGSNAAAAAFSGALDPPLSMARTYLNLGLWRGRGVYDAAAGAALVVGGAWWFLHADRGPSESTVRWLCVVPLVAAAGGAWLRFRGQGSGPPPLLTDVMLALDSWEHKRRRTDELSYETAIAARLRELGFDAAQGERIDGGREADIVVRPRGSIGAWNWRDVMIEMKAHLTTTNERDRAMGQLETYASTWPGAIVLMICGDLRRELLPPLHTKVATLRGQGRSVAIVVKGRAADGVTP